MLVGPAHCGKYHPGQLVLDDIRKKAKQAINEQASKYITLLWPLHWPLASAPAILPLASYI